MSDKLDQIQASYIDTYKGVGAYSKLRAALLKWRDKAVVAAVVAELTEVDKYLMDDATPPREIYHNVTMYVGKRLRELEAE